jgi:hypothetical protein
MSAGVVGVLKQKRVGGVQNGRTCAYEKSGRNLTIQRHMTES